MSDLRSMPRHVEVDSPGLVAFWLRGLRTGKFWAGWPRFAPRRRFFWFAPSDVLKSALKYVVKYVELQRETVLNA